MERVIAISAGVQAAATVLLLLVTRYYAKHAAKLEQRKAARDVRERRSLAVPLLSKLERLRKSAEQSVEGIGAKAVYMDGQGRLGFVVPEHLAHEASKLLPDALRIDSGLADALWTIRGLGQAESGPHNAARRDEMLAAAQRISGELSKLTERCRRIVHGSVKPV